MYVTESFYLYSVCADKEYKASQEVKVISKEDSFQMTCQALLRDSLHLLEV